MSAPDGYGTNVPVAAVVFAGLIPFTLAVLIGGFLLHRRNLRRLQQEDMNAAYSPHDYGLSTPSSKTFASTNRTSHLSPKDAEYDCTHPSMPYMFSENIPSRERLNILVRASAPGAENDAYSIASRSNSYADFSPALSSAGFKDRIGDSKNELEHLSDYKALRELAPINTNVPIEPPYFPQLRSSPIKKYASPLRSPLRTPDEQGLGKHAYTSFHEPGPFEGGAAQNVKRYELTEDYFESPQAATQYDTTRWPDAIPAALPQVASRERLPIGVRRGSARGRYF